jgi:SAD/SRA domain
MGADNLLELMYAASVKEGALALLRSAKDGKPVRVVRSNVLESAYKAISNERRRSSAPQFYRYDGVYKINKVQYRDPGCGVQDYVGGVTETPKTRVFLFYMERCGNGVGPGDNKIPNADYAQFCIDRGSMSPDALTALSQTVPLAFQLPVNIFNQEFLGALSLLTIHQSTKVESLLCPGLQLLANWAESTEVESLLCPGLQLLSALLEPCGRDEAAQKRPAVLEPHVDNAEPLNDARKVESANFSMNESRFTTSAKAARCKGRPVNGKRRRATLQAPAFRKLRDRVLNHVYSLDIARKRPAMLEPANEKADPLKAARNASPKSFPINEGKKRRRLDLSANALIPHEAAESPDSPARRSPRFAVPFMNSTAAAKETVAESCSAKQMHRSQKIAITCKRTSPRLAKVVAVVSKTRPARKSPTKLSRPSRRIQPVVQKVSSRSKRT